MKIQIGKKKLTNGTFKVLENAFKTHNDVKISVLKSAGHNKENIKKMAEEIVSRLGKKFTYKIVGFTIFIKKWRKLKKKKGQV